SQVSGFSQSKGGVPEREPTLRGRPRASSRSTTRRPVLPVPLSTRVFLSFVDSWFIGSPLVDWVGLVRRSPAGRPWTCAGGAGRARPEGRARGAESSTAGRPPAPRP